MNKANNNFKKLDSGEMKKLVGGISLPPPKTKWQCNVPGQDPGSFACSADQPQTLCGSVDPCIPVGSCEAVLDYCPF